MPVTIQRRVPGFLLPNVLWRVTYPWIVFSMVTLGLWGGYRQRVGFVIGWILGCILMSAWTVNALKVGIYLEPNRIICRGAIFRRSIERKSIVGITISEAGTWPGVGFKVSDRSGEPAMTFDIDRNWVTVPQFQRPMSVPGAVRLAMALQTWWVDDVQRGDAVTPPAVGDRRVQIGYPSSGEDQVLQGDPRWAPFVELRDLVTKRRGAARSGSG